jgi:hypothetical protein
VLFGRISEHFAQLTNRRIQTIIEVDKSFRGPESLAQDLATHQRAALL